MKLLIDIKWL